MEDLQASVTWASLPTSTAAALSLLSELSRPNNGDAQLGDDQLLIVRALALVSAAISLIFAVLVLYWFLHMKRSFRHQSVIPSFLSSRCVLSIFWVMVR